MPIECDILEDRPCPLAKCPKCGAAPFEPFMRGTVQRMAWSPWKPWTWFRTSGMRPYCAVICRDCKEIVGYEMP